MFKAILFDIDGTLTDTNPVFLKALKQAYHEFSGEEKPSSFFSFSLGIPSPQTMEILGIREAERTTFRERWQGLIREYMPEARLFPGILELLTHLQARGVPMALVTSKIRAEMPYEFDCFGINHFFAFTVCADDVPRPKPFPDPLLFALDRLHVSPRQALFVGESLYDLKAAKSAHVPFALAKWGVPRTEEILPWQPEYVLEEPRELLSLLEGRGLRKTLLLGGVE